MSTVDDRTPPQDLAAERCVLGGMMLAKHAIEDAVEALRPNAFYRPAHQAVYDAIVDLYTHDEPADPITVADALERRGELGRVGGPHFLLQCVHEVPTAANTGYYARIVTGRAVRRQLTEAGTGIAQLGYTGSDDTDDEIADLLERAQAIVAGVADTGSRDDVLPLESLLQPAMDELDRIQSGTSTAGVPTGIADLDEVTTGLHPGQMIVVAGRPGTGKSVLGRQLLRSCALRAGRPGVLFSLEMSRTEITQCLLAAECRISLQDMRTGRMCDDDWTRMARRMSEISEAPLFIDDSPNMTMMEIRAKARRLKQRHDLSLIVVDYLQLMSSGKRVESRQQEVSEFSRALKLLAKELEVPVVALSQLNRGVEHRTDKRPTLADLRESGAIEQDADMVILINRPDAYERDDPRAGEADLILAKHRGGPTSTISVAHQMHYSRFADLARRLPTAVDLDVEPERAYKDEAA